MISVTEINKNLAQLNRRYLKPRLKMEPIWCSKLAILEVCGWIEMALDDMLMNTARGNLRIQANIEWYENRIDKNYGFHYERNVRPVMVELMGIVRVELVEKNVDPIKRQQLQSELGTLSKTRNGLAHTYIRGVTTQIDAPSVTISRLARVHGSLVDYEQVINAVI